MATLAALLSAGYFPRELPPPFTTVSFARHALKVGASWPKGNWTRSAFHNLARPGGLRRPLKIPHPVAHFVLAEVLANDWDRIKAHTWKERLSASRPYLMKTSLRAVVPRYRYSELPRLRALRRRGARYLLHTDINQFYPALYTHTIPWAIHTKSRCKIALSTPGKGKTWLGNRIDKALQSMNEGQTHGIPIGPDCSLVVAEIILAAVDQELIRRCPEIIHGFRYVDDYELSFGTLSDAEQVLTELQGILSAYELGLNPRKTRIEELPRPLEDSWASELGRFDVRKPTHPVSQRNDVVALFSRAFEMASERPESSVLRYAIARVQNLDVHASGWRAFQNCVLDTVSADASTLAVALGTLHQTSLAGGHAVAKSPLGETFEYVISRHAPRGEGSEVAWALWGALAWAVPLSAAAAKAVSKMDDNIVALLALDADAHGLFPKGALDRSIWTALVVQADVLSSEHWLLAYEAHRKRWLPTKAVAKDPIFSVMSRAAVRFYDRSQNKPQFPAAGRSFPGGTIQDYYA